MADTGTGTTVAFGTSSYSVNITNLSIDGEEVEVFDVSHFGTTGYKEKIFSSLSEPPQFTCDVLYDPDEPAPVSGAVETITITFPVPAGSSNGATLAGTGKIISTGADIPHDGVMTGQYVVQYDGQTGPTFTDAS